MDDYTKVIPLFMCFLAFSLPLLTTLHCQCFFTCLNIFVAWILSVYTAWLHLKFQWEGPCFSSFSCKRTSQQESLHQLVGYLVSHLTSKKRINIISVRLMSPLYKKKLSALTACYTTFCKLDRIFWVGIQITTQILTYLSRLCNL